MSPRPQGLRVCCPTKPERGVGHVLSDDGGAKVTVFFLGGGKRTLDTTIAELDLVTGPAAVHPILDVAAQANWQHAHFNPMPYDLATVMEVELARQLREQGCGLWQN